MRSILSRCDLCDAPGCWPWLAAPVLLCSDRLFTHSLGLSCSVLHPTGTPDALSVREMQSSAVRCSGTLAVIDYARVLEPGAAGHSPARASGRRASPEAVPRAALDRGDAGLTGRQPFAVPSAARQWHRQLNPQRHDDRCHLHARCLCLVYRRRLKLRTVPVVRAGWAHPPFASPQQGTLARSCLHGNACHALQWLGISHC